MRPVQENDSNVNRTFFYVITYWFLFYFFIFFFSKYVSEVNFEITLGKKVTSSDITLRSFVFQAPQNIYTRL